MAFRIITANNGEYDYTPLVEAETLNELIQQFIKGCKDGTIQVSENLETKTVYPIMEVKNDWDLEIICNAIWGVDPNDKPVLIIIHGNKGITFDINSNRIEPYTNPN